METEKDPIGYRLFVGVDIAAATAMAAWQPVGGKAGRPVQIARCRSPRVRKDTRSCTRSSARVACRRGRRWW